MIASGLLIFKMILCWFWCWGFISLNLRLKLKNEPELNCKCWMSYRFCNWHGCYSVFHIRSVTMSGLFRINNSMRWFKKKKKKVKGREISSYLVPFICCPSLLRLHTRATWMGSLASECNWGQPTWNNGRRTEGRRRRSRIFIPPAPLLESICVTY